MAVGKGRKEELVVVVRLVVVVAAADTSVVCLLFGPLRFSSSLPVIPELPLRHRRSSLRFSATSVLPRTYLLISFDVFVIPLGFVLHLVVWVRFSCVFVVRHCC